MMHHRTRFPCMRMCMRTADGEDRLQEGSRCGKPVWGTWFQQATHRLQQLAVDKRETESHQPCFGFLWFPRGVSL